MPAFFHRIAGFALAFGALTLAGCCPQTCQSPVLTPAPVSIPQTHAAPVSPVNPGDVLKVTVMGETDLSGDYVVSKDGAITMPMVGSIAVQDHAAASLAGIIADAYRGDYLKDPQVLVELKTGKAL